MIIKLFMKILLGNKDSIIKAIKLNGKHYVLTIEEFKSSSDYIKDCKEKVL